MERGDLVTILAGIVIVVVMALTVQYSGLFRTSSEGPPAGTQVPATVLPQTTAPIPTGEIALTGTAVPAPAPIPPDPVPYRIFYSSRPLTYPVFKLPENMETFGATDIPWKDPDVVTFAYIEETRGGLTEKFSIPYGLWRMNISVDAWTKPQYSRFEMVICYGSDGRVIDGIEIFNRGSAFRNVQVSHTDLYIIVHTQNVDKFRITFETPRSYYTRIA